LEIEFLEYDVSVRTTIKPSKSDPLNKHRDMLQFWNLMLVEDQSYHERIRYKMTEIMGEVGGIIAVLMPLMWVLMYPLTYKIHHISVYKEYLDQKSQADLTLDETKYPKFLSIKYFLYK